MLSVDNLVMTSEHELTQKELAQIKEKLAKDIAFDGIYSEYLDDDRIFDNLHKIIPHLQNKQYSIELIVSILNTDIDETSLVQILHFIIEAQPNCVSDSLLKGQNPSLPYSGLLLKIFNQPISKSIKRHFKLSVDQLKKLSEQIIFFYGIGMHSNIVILQNLNSWTHVIIDNNFLTIQLNAELKELIQELLRLQRIYNAYMESVKNIRLMLSFKKPEVKKIEKKITRVYF